MTFLPRGQLGRWLADRDFIWQMQLLNQNRFASYVKDRGLSYSFGSDIRQLWQVGLLKADLIVAPCELGVSGLELFRIGEEGDHLYLDMREGFPAGGLSGSLSRSSDLPCEVDLYFHPFRYYVLYEIDRILKPNIHPKQQLLNPAGYHTALEHWQAHFDQWTANPEFQTQLQYWEGTAELAIATEPCAYTRIFGTTRRPIQTDKETQQAAISAHWEELRPYYERIERDSIEPARRELCITAEMLDPNKTVHTILRFTSGESRITNVKGRLGGSLLLLAMAEVIRRAEEEAFDVKLLEEDELGFGIVYRDARRELYGSERLLDGSRRVADEFLRQQGLDYGVRVRWYVEGKTEYHAIEGIIEHFSAIQLVDLRGRVVERGDKGVSFRDSLRLDIAAGIFSWVSVDGDRDDYVRAVRKAAEADEICGMFYVAEPDFELANFTLAELEEVLWEIALENGADPSSRAILHCAIQDSRSAEELLKAARRSLPELVEVGKGAEWGRHLMVYAQEHTDLPFGYPTEKQPRPVLDAVQWAIQAAHVNYKYNREKYRTDPVTGKIIPRQASET